VLRGDGAAREERPADIRAEGAGVYAITFDRDGASDVKLRLSRPEALPPSRSTRVRVRALTANGAVGIPRLASIDVDLPASGKPVELAWQGERFVQ
jgi:hypothetical protein